MIALSYGERGESGELWKQEGQTVENVKRIRHAEAEAAAAHLGASFRCLDLGDYPLQIDGERAAGDRRRDPRVRARRADHPHRHRPVQPRPSGGLRRGRPGARPGRGRRRLERVRDDQAAAAVPVRAPPARAVQLHADRARRHHRGVGAEARGDGRDEGPAVPADLLRPARRAARQPRAARVRRSPTCATASRSSACSRRWWRSCERRRARPPRRRDRLRGVRPPGPRRRRVAASSSPARAPAGRRGSRAAGRTTT